MDIRSTRPWNNGKGPDANTSTRLETLSRYSSRESTPISPHMASSFLNQVVSFDGAWLGIGNIRNVVSPTISDSDTSVVLKFGSHPTPSKKSGL